MYLQAEKCDQKWFLLLSEKLLFLKREPFIIFFRKKYNLFDTQNIIPWN